MKIDQLDRNKILIKIINILYYNSEFFPIAKLILSELHNEETRKAMFAYRFMTYTYLTEFLDLKVSTINNCEFVDWDGDCEQQLIDSCLKPLKSNSI